MVWGQSGTRGIEDLVQRVGKNDPKLESLTILRQRRFGHEDVASLVRAMSSNTHLTELYASSHSLAPQTVSLLADMLANSTSLRALCVGDSSLGDEGVLALAPGVAKCSLTRLDLGGKGLSARGTAAIASALATASSLSHLVLSSNAGFADAGLRALCYGAADADAAGNSAPPLWAAVRVLELQGCGITAEGVLVLAGSPNCAQLEVLRLEGNCLGAGAAAGQALAALLKAAVKLRGLHLRATGLGDEAGRLVASSLTYSEEVPAAAGGSLEQLDMSECDLGPQTMAAFNGAFASGARLELLNLAGNAAIRDEDVAALGDILAARAQPALAHLDLSATQAGALAVAALSKAPGLRHLSLVGCPLGSAGATALASSLEAGGWADLRELCLSGCGLSKADVGGLVDALAAGGAPALQSVEIGANPATQDDDFPSLLEALRASRPGVAVYWRSGDDPAPVVR